MDKKTKYILIAVAVLIVVAIVVVLIVNGNKGTTKADTIIGTWKYESADYAYTFNEDGTGKYEAMGTTMEFTYTTEGNKLSITYTGNTSPFETEYSIDGNKLNVKDSFGQDTIYKRQK